MDFSLGSTGVSLGLSGGNLGFGDRTLANLTCEMAENRARILAQGGAGLLLPSTGMLKQTRSASEVEMELESREEAMVPLKLARPYQHDPYLYRPSGMHMSMSREGLSFYDAAANGGRYPFTAAQWAELEHQALIYKYIIHGYPVPDDLLVPIRKSVAALSGLPYGMSGVGWGSFSLGAGSSVDAEPGRCRRTDGKKWRCSRPVVPEQKYCERHMHRGRHRSRKAAEAQANSLSQQPPTSTPPPAPAAVSTQHPSLLTQSSPSISLKPAMVVNSASQQQASAASLATKAFLNPPSATAITINPSCSSAAFSNNHFQLPPQSPSASMVASKDPRFVNGLSNLRPEHLLASEVYGSSSRMLMEQKQSLPWPAHAQLSKLPPLLHQKPSSNSFYLYDSPVMIMQEASPLSPFIDHQQQQQQQQQLGYFHSRHPPMEAADVKSENQPLRHFFDDWPRSRDSSNLSWSDAEEEKQPQPKSSATQLSISITAASDLTSSPARSKTVFSPLRLSMSRAGTEDAAADPTHMGLGMALTTSHQSLWFPMSSMENPMGGPLAEALQSSGPHAANKAGGGGGGLNLLGDGGRNDSSPQESCRLASPTGVLQKTFGCCFSDSSSSASSPASGKPEAAACDQNLKAHLTNGSPHVAT